jgi:ATP/ADP translocase
MAPTHTANKEGDRPGRAFARRAFATLFLILAAHTLTETARDALFLSRLPVSQLPWVYLLVALVTVTVVRGTAGMAAQLRRFRISGFLLASALISCLFWAISGARSPLFLYVLYLWPGVFGSIVIVEFWWTISDAYTIVEAKTIFGRIGAGGTAGGVAGAGLAVALTNWLPPAALLLAASACQTVGVVTALKLTTPRAQTLAPPPAAPATSSLTTIARDRYLLGVAACLFLVTVIATLTDFAFKRMLARAAVPGDIARIVAGVSFAANIGALVLQVTLVGPVVRRLGVTRTLAVLPAAVSAAAAVLIGVPGLIGAAALRLTDSTLRYSLHRAASDLLYVPLSPEARARTKMLIDVLTQRGGQVVGSLGILLALFLGGGERVLACCTAVIGTVAALIAVRLTRPYLDVFRSTLKAIGTPTRLALPAVDVDSLTSLVAAFSGEHDPAVVAAMDLAAEQRGAGVIPVVMLFHPSRNVVLRALELFERHRRVGYEWALRRLAADASDSQIRAAAVAGLAYSQNDPAALRPALDDADEHVRVAALACLVGGGWMENDEAASALSQAVRRTSVSGKMTFAAAMKRRPSALFEGPLLELADAWDLDVRDAAADAMAAQPSVRFLPSLLPMLAESRLRDTARDALVAIGAPALEFLAASLDDETLPRGIRLHLPRSIGRFPPANAVAPLWRRLQAERDELIRFKILRAVGRLVTDDPTSRPAAPAIRQAIDERSTVGLRYAWWHATLDREGSRIAASPTGRILQKLVADKQTRAVEIVFRLLALGNPGEDFERIYRALHGSRTDRANGRELLEGVVDTAMRDIVLALLEDPPDPWTLARFSPSTYRTHRNYHEIVADIIEQSTGVLRAFAVRHAEEMGILSAM